MAKAGRLLFGQATSISFLSFPAYRLPFGRANHECPWGGLYPLALAPLPHALAIGKFWCHCCDIYPSWTFLAHSMGNNLMLTSAGSDCLGKKAGAHRVDRKDGELCWENEEESQEADGTKQTGCSRVAALPFALLTLQPQGALLLQWPPNFPRACIHHFLLTQFPLRVTNGLTPLVWACPTSRVENGNTGHVPHLPRLAVGVPVA